VPELWAVEKPVVSSLQSWGDLATVDEWAVAQDSDGDLRVAWEQRHRLVQRRYEWRHSACFQAVFDHCHFEVLGQGLQPDSVASVPVEALQHHLAVATAYRSEAGRNAHFDHNREGRAHSVACQAEVYKAALAAGASWDEVQFDTEPSELLWPSLQLVQLLVLCASLQRLPSFR
jgi:hypothetical protein